jgi:general L-amino acid transport system substrate-binding protein
MVTSATNASTLEDLEGATICVQSGPTTELNLTDQMRALGVEFSPQVFGDIDATYDAYSQGRCDAVTSDRSQLVARRTQFTNPDDHVILDVVMSK